MAANDDQQSSFFDDALFDPTTTSLLQTDTSLLCDIPGNTFDFSEADFASLLQTTTMPQLEQGHNNDDHSRGPGDEIRYEDIQKLQKT